MNGIMTSDTGAYTEYQRSRTTKSRLGGAMRATRRRTLPNMNRVMRWLPLRGTTTSFTADRKVPTVIDVPNNPARTLNATLAAGVMGQASHAE